MSPASSLTEGIDLTQLHPSGPYSHSLYLEQPSFFAARPAGSSGSTSLSGCRIGTCCAAGPSAPEIPRNLFFGLKKTDCFPPRSAPGTSGSARTDFLFWMTRTPGRSLFHLPSAPTSFPLSEYSSSLFLSLTSGSSDSRTPACA